MSRSAASFHQKCYRSLNPLAGMGMRWQIDVEDWLVVAADLTGLQPKRRLNERKSVSKI